MNNHTAFDTFMRAAFGMEPGGDTGNLLAALATSLSLARGKIVPLDNSTDQIACIAHGATKLAVHASGDREQIVAFHFAGDIVSIPSDSSHAYVMSSLVETEVLVFPARQFFDQASAESTMARALFERLPAALNRCREKAVALGRMSAHERLAGFLIAMAERVGKRVDDRIVLNLPMSRQDIGDSLGLTIETVSRQVGVMRDAGLIETKGRSQIVLRDIRALAERAGHAHQTNKNLTKNPKFDLDQCVGRSKRLAVRATEGA